jgi:hypothetical protein
MTMAENPRTTAARDHDDSAIIDAAVAEGSGGTVGTAGGGLAQDIATQDELARAVDDPEAHTRATKSDDIANNQARASDRGPNRQ